MSEFILFLCLVLRFLRALAPRSGQAFVTGKVAATSAMERSSCMWVGLTIVG